MYTFESKFFSEQFKQVALQAISKARSSLMPEDFVKEVGSAYEAESVMSGGHRWRDDEQCYQSMVMSLSGHLRDVRGPGFMTEQEAEDLERSMSRPEPNGLTIESAAKMALLNAISCDHWYMFEKQWD